MQPPLLPATPLQRWSLALLFSSCCGAPRRSPGGGGGGGAAAGSTPEEERVWVACLARLPLDTATHPELGALLTGMYQAWTGETGDTG